jgi:hypothetical protein
MVLCIGSDGHVATEAAGEARCADASRDVIAAHESGPDALRDGSGPDCAECGPCTDLPIGGRNDQECASFRTESGPTAQTILAIASVLPPADRSAGNRVGLPAAADALADAANAPASARSRVLLL